MDCGLVESHEVNGPGTVEKKPGQNLRHVCGKQLIFG
jgi:hypothetical protein